MRPGGGSTCHGSLTGGMREMAGDELCLGVGSMLEAAAVSFVCAASIFRDAIWSLIIAFCSRTCSCNDGTVGMNSVLGGSSVVEIDVAVGVRFALG